MILPDNKGRRFELTETDLRVELSEIEIKMKGWFKSAKVHGTNIEMFIWSWNKNENLFDGNYKQSLVRWSYFRVVTDPKSELDR